MAALALPLRAGDGVLVSDGEFPGNVYPWPLQARRGVQAELMPRTREGWPDEAQLLDRLADPRVRVVAVSFVQFASGYRADLDRLGAVCRERGAFLVVDAIQGLGQCPLDVARTSVDLLSCGAQYVDTLSPTSDPAEDPYRVRVTLTDTWGLTGTDTVVVRTLHPRWGWRSRARVIRS